MIKKLGVPKSSREAFTLLQDSGIIDPALSKILKNIVGFRNIAVHDYQALDLNILKAILDKHTGDFKRFTMIVLKMDH